MVRGETKDMKIVEKAEFLGSKTLVRFLLPMPSEGDLSLVSLDFTFSESLRHMHIIETRI